MTEMLADDVARLELSLSLQQMHQLAVRLNKYAKVIGCARQFTHKSNSPKHTGKLWPRCTTPPEKVYPPDANQSASEDWAWRD